ncbi:BTAD domain-containing putative transcriptional regulator [Cryptosporangium arvum]|uniref:Putative ATPase n=1 Tax=Cryptosporangium arvum DSM 44712 TaxID=927661 RepID=A0A010YH48_9ACTN|nr:BTAD domain-containing putative transcriptional regulator [Cryptosporangium arvum]EXG79600.1 putative ATPase [Cryptosporangium arvum DSM 44712]
MRFRILGPIQVETADGRTVPVGGSRLRAALAVLLTEAGRIVPAQRLIDGVYGDAPPAGATNALQSQVSRLRQLLGGAAVVEFHPAGYRLAVDPDHVDAHRFRRLVAEAARVADPVALLDEALGLWRGPALADAGDTTLIRAAAAELDDARLSALDARIAARLELGHASDDLVAEVRALVAEHPLRESFRVHLMRALHTTGHSAAALLAFEDARRTLADELGVDPSAELREAHLALLRRPEPRAQAPRRLPAQLTSFVGREHELARLADLLGTQRLVTLTGPGGAGKTRLAIEAAERHPAESHLVELATVTTGAEIEQVVLDALGLRDSGLRPASPAANPLDRLVAALADRPALLIVDNCEHLIDAAATLVDHLLRRCPSLRALATSREPLGITGEHLLPVRALGLPADGDPPERIRGAPAVRLFAERASAALPGFSVDATNAPDVLRICRTLDGQPLALELAAARLRSLALGEVASRLDDRFRLLNRGERTAPARHRTLRAAIEWSWELLADDERTLARRLTVFVGGATLEAIDQVCGPTDADSLSGLVDKSLVEFADGRYRMLDTIRVFGEERLAESGELKRLRRAHAEYFLELALTGDAALRTADQLRWAAVLDRERENLHSAARWSGTADPASGLRLTAALAMYSWIRGRRSEFAALARDLLESVGPRPPHGLEEEHAICVLSARLGGHDGNWSSGGAAWSANPNELYRPPRLPFLNALTALSAGPPADSEYTKLENWYRASELDPWTAALQQFGLAYMRAMNSGDLAGAVVSLEASMAGFRAIGERWGETMALTELADLAEARGEQDRFLALNEQAMRLAVELESDEDRGGLFCRRATNAARFGDLDTADALYRHAAELGGRAGASDVQARALAGHAHVRWLRGDVEGARRRYEQGLTELTGAGYLTNEIRALLTIGLGWVAYATGDPALARERHRSALVSGVQSYSPVAGDVAEGLAAAALAEGDPTTAATLLGLVPALRGGLVASFPGLPPTADAAREALGPSAYDQAYGLGAALSRDEATELLRRPPSELPEGVRRGGTCRQGRRR